MSAETESSHWPCWLLSSCMCQGIVLWAGRGLFRKLRDRGSGQGVLHQGEGRIEAPVQGTERGFVGFAVQGAGGDSLDGVDCLDHIQEGDLGRILSEREPPMESSLGLHEPCAAQGLEDLGEVPGTNVGSLRDLARGLGLGRVVGQPGQGLHGVLGGV